LSGSLIAPSVGLMTEFLAEIYVSATETDSIADLVTCARIAAEEQSERGVPVRYVRAILVPEEETCFVFYDAPSREDATDTARLAGFAVVCIAAAETTADG
jgi:hypothetical protein